MAAHIDRAERLTTFQDDVADLLHVLGRLRWRLGLERVAMFVVRGIIAAALGLIGLLLAAWLLPIGNWTDLAYVVALPVVAALLVAVVRWPSNRQTALAADRRLKLDERLGTAVEVARRSRITRTSGGRFDGLQVRDAIARTRAAPVTWLAIDSQMRREALLALALTVLGAMSVALPGLPRPGLPVADPLGALSDVAPPTAALETPQLAPVDQSSVDAQLIQPTQADAGLASRVQQEQAERDDLDSLAQAVGRVSAGQGAADAIQRGDFPAARDQLATLGEEADQLSDAAKQQLSRALQQAANASAATDRALSDRERQAAQALSRNTYADQRQALRNLADQVAKSGARTGSANQLAQDRGRLQQQSASQGTPTQSQAQGASAQAQGAQGQQPAQGNDPAQDGAGAASSGQAGASAAGQQGGPGTGTGANPDGLGDQQSRLDTAGQRVEVPIKLGTGPGVRPPDGSEDQTGADPAAAARSVSEQAQAQRTGQVAPEQNLVPGEQRPVVRGYFR